MGGCDKIRPLWRHYFQQTQAVIYVVDCADAERLVNPDPSSTYDVYASSGLKFICEEPELRGAIILVMANKQDLPGCLSVEEIRTRLCLDSAFPDRLIHLQGCSALTKEGMTEGLDWLHDALLRPRGSTRSSSSLPPPPPGGDAASEGAVAQLSPAEQEAQRLEALLLEWLDREDVPAEVFLSQVADASLDVWDHYTHLRIAWLNLTLHGRRDGMEKIFTSIESFIKRSPRTRRSDTSRGTTFHETMTYFWVHMVHYAMTTMQQAPARTSSSSHGPVDESKSGRESFDVKEESKSNDKEESSHLITSFKRFLLMNPQLVNGGLFLHYYSKQRMLMDAEARTSVLLPDVRPLPSVLHTASPVAGSTHAGPAATPTHLRLQPRAPLNDVDFLLAIKQRVYGSWGHDILIRVIYVMLMDQEKRQAKSSDPKKRNVEEIFDILRQVEAENFHTSLNYFWVQMVSHSIALVRQKLKEDSEKESSSTSPPTAAVIPAFMDFDVFYRQPDCQRLRNQLLYEKYYGRSTIDSQEAMESLVLPNLKQFPNIVQHGVDPS